MHHHAAPALTACSGRTRLESRATMRGRSELLEGGGCFVWRVCSRIRLYSILHCCLKRISLLGSCVYCFPPISSSQSQPSSTDRMPTIVRKKTLTTLPKYWTHVPRKVCTPHPVTQMLPNVCSHTEPGNLTIIGQHPRRIVEVVSRKPNEAGGGFRNDPHESYEQALSPSLL
jgi:hypothetical protein